MRWLTDRLPGAGKAQSKARGKAPATPKAGVKAKRANPKWRRTWRQLGWGSLGLSLAGAVWGLVWLHQVGWYGQQIDRANAALLGWTADLGFRVEDVLVTGRARTEQQEILQALGVDKGLPLFDFDPHAAKQRLEALPWVASAVVERRLPGNVYVALTERRPMALWQLDRDFSLIDDSGDVIPVQAEDLQLRFRDLLQVVGDDAPPHTATLIALLRSQPALRGQVAAATRMGKRRWNIHLRNGIDVKLPEDGAESAWNKLADLDRRHGLLARDITVIDLRQPDRLIVRQREAEGQGTDA